MEPKLHARAARFAGSLRQTMSEPCHFADKTALIQQMPSRSSTKINELTK